MSEQRTVLRGTGRGSGVALSRHDDYDVVAGTLVYEVRAERVVRDIHPAVLALIREVGGDAWNLVLAEGE